MKRRFCILITILAVTWVQMSPVFAVSAEPGNLEAKSAIVMDADTGKILYQKDANTKREPASITKIVTCMLALEHLKLDQVVTVSGKPETLGNVMYLKEGEKITVEDLLHALMVYSANDAAVILAKEVGGTVESFAQMMNEKARECGAKNTHFLNPNGLNWAGQEAHLTTAYDMAVITRMALKNQTFRKLIATTQYTIPATNKSKARTLTSTNLCLFDMKTKIKVAGHERTPKYDGTIGVKTGLTSTAGACFVGAVDRNGTELISVVLHSGEETRFSDTIALWDYSLNAFYDTHEVVKQNQEFEKVRIKRGAHRSVVSVSQSSAYATIPKGVDTKGIKTVFVKKEVKAPVEKGQQVGTIKVYNGDKLISETDALAAEAVEKGGPLSYIGIPDWLAMVIYTMLGIILAILVIFRALGRRNSQRNQRHRVRKRRNKRREKDV